MVPDPDDAEEPTDEAPDAPTEEAAADVADATDVSTDAAADSAGHEEQSPSEPTTDPDPAAAGEHVAEPAATPAFGEVSSDERTWGILAHAAAFVGLVVPFGNILGPLLVWVIKKDESAFVAANGRESLNFQITWTILFIGALLSLVILIGFLLVPLIAIAWLVLVVLAIVRASENEVYDYPLTADFVK